MPPLATLSRSRPLFDVVSAQAGTGASALLGEARELAEGWGGEAVGRGEAVAVALPNGCSDLPGMTGQTMTVTPAPYDSEIGRAHV